MKTTVIEEATPQRDVPNMNGLTIIVRTKEAIYVRLPKDAQYQSGFGVGVPCTCGHCDGVGAMDTLVIPTGLKEHHTHTVHMPERSVQSFMDYMRAKNMLIEGKRY